LPLSCLTHAQSGPVPAPQTGMSKARAKRMMPEVTDLIRVFNASGGPHGARRQSRRIAAQPAHPVSGARAII
jgi:hypothetical protein